MSEAFQNKTARVILVDPSGPVRQMMSDVVRGLGFESVEGRSSIADLLEHLEIEEAEWVIVPTMSDQSVNAMHLLQVITQTPELKGTRVSLLVEETERSLLPSANELGLMSWHDKPFNKESLTASFTKLMTSLGETGWDTTRTAAHYLREYLTISADHTARCDLEKALVDYQPGNVDQLIQYARALQAAEEADQAKAILGQAKLLAAESPETIDRVATELFGSADLTAENMAGSNALGLKTAVIIDSDGAVTTDIETTLKEIGVEYIHIFHDGESAWSHLSESEEPDLIVQEWRIPKLSGPFLLQNVRHKGFTSVPVIVASSLLKTQDMPLLREMGVAKIVAKPLVKKVFLSGLIWTIQQERSPSEHQALERKIRTLLTTRKYDKARALKPKFIGADEVSLARKHLIEAEFAFAEKDYLKARDHAATALKASSESILVLNLLGKIFMQLNEHESALKCFTKAQDLSPTNIERLCTIAEVNTELGDHTAAEDAMASAEDLDPDSEQVKEGKAKVALAKGDTAAAASAMAGLKSLSTLIGYMNNKAVALARCGNTDEAIELYNNTCESIPKDREDLVAIVKYNLALALVRADRFDEAQSVLKAVNQIKTSRVKQKAASLSLRLKRAIDDGASFELRSSIGAPESKGSQAKVPANDSQIVSPEDNAKLLAKIATEPGDLCCYKIFHVRGETPAKVEAMLAKPPRFKRRDTIEREEALGAEKTSKAS